MNSIENTNAVNTTELASRIRNAAAMLRLCLIGLSAPEHSNERSNAETALYGVRDLLDEAESMADILDDMTDFNDCELIPSHKYN